MRKHRVIDVLKRFVLPKTEKIKNINIHLMQTLHITLPEIYAFNRPQKVYILEECLELKTGKYSKVITTAVEITKK